MKKEISYVTDRGDRFAVVYRHGSGWRLSVEFSGDSSVRTPEEAHDLRDAISSAVFELDYVIREEARAAAAPAVAASEEV